MKKKLVAAAFAAALVSVPMTGIASADTGGVPDPNAFGEFNPDANGRMGSGCVPPGFLFKQFAQEEGPNQLFGQAPGQLVVNQCT